MAHALFCEALGILAAVIGIAGALCPLIQVRHMLARRSAEDVSLGWLTVYAVGSLVWLLYGISITNTPLIATQSIAGATGVLTLATAARLQRQAGWIAGSGEPVGRAPSPPGSPVPRCSLDVTVSEAVRGGDHRGACATPAAGDRTAVSARSRRTR